MGIKVNELIYFMFTLILGYEGPFTVAALRFSIDRFQIPNQNICQLNNILNVYCIDGIDSAINLLTPILP